MDNLDLCKNCRFFKPDSCACTHRKMKVSPKSPSCNAFNKNGGDMSGTGVCGTCRHGYFPDKSYPNYMAYINCNGEFFMCKCTKHPFAKFLKQKACQDYAKN